jgi:predicted membrane-bound spermidine synthase
LEFYELSFVMAMKWIKVLLIAILSGVGAPPLVGLFLYQGEPLQPIVYALFTALGLGAGAFVSRYISWGWAVGGFAGLLLGLFGPMPLMFVFPDTRYEAVLPWLVCSAVVGMLVAGYLTDKVFRSRWP